MQYIDLSNPIPSEAPEVTVVNTPSTAASYSPVDEAFGDTHSVHRTKTYQRIAKARSDAAQFLGEHITIGVIR